MTQELAVRGNGAAKFTLEPRDMAQALQFAEVIAKSDLLILSTPHRLYRTADLAGKPIVDIWGILDNANVIR